MTLEYIKVPKTIDTRPHLSPHLVNHERAETLSQVVFDLSPWSGTTAAAGAPVAVAWEGCWEGRRGELGV